MRYDLMILGDDPAGLEAAAAACRRNLLVAVVLPVGTTAAHRYGLTSRGLDALVGEVRFLDGHHVLVRTADEPVRLAATTFVIACGNAGPLHLPAVGIEPDECGRLWCNADFQTWLPHIYAAGDSVGFPAALDLSPQEQGRHIVRHAFDPSCRPEQFWLSREEERELMAV